MILLAKAGLNAREVAAMTHAEAAAWADDVLLGLGIKGKGDGEVIISQRRKKPE